MKDIVSIIFCHYADNKNRAEMSRKSYQSLSETIKDYPAELIVVDSGEFEEDSKFFLKETIAKRITHYIRNADRLWYGFARNQALDISTGKYICVTDNDIVFERGWLEECLDVLSKVQGKYHITPIELEWAHFQEKYKREPIMINGTTYQTNAMAGSSCWIMTRQGYEEIGKFNPFLYNTGTKWSQDSCRVGYSVILLPKAKVQNCGGKRTPYAGINRKRDCDFDMVKHFTNGETINMNPERR